MISNFVCFIFGAVGVLTIGISMKIVGEIVEEGTSETFLKLGDALQRIAVLFGADRSYAPKHAAIREEENI